MRGQPGISDALAVVERLHRLVGRLPELGEDGRWLAGALETFLDPHAVGLSLEQAAGISIGAGGEHWRSAMRRALRDQALRELAHRFFAGLSTARQAAAAHRALRRYESTRWRRVDRYRAEMPQAYIGTADECLFMALRHGRGRVPLGDSRLREILSRCSHGRKSADAIADFIGGDMPYSEIDHATDGSMARLTDVTAILSQTPAFKAAVAERDAAGVLHRRGLIATIKKLERQAERDFHEQHASIDSAFALLKERETALIAARHALNLANVQRSTASYRYTRERDAIEAELIESANPAIDAFVSEMRDAVDLTRKMIGYVERIERNEITGKGRHVVISNTEAIKARIAAINTAIERAQELRVTEADQSVVPAQLEKLRAGLPIVSQPHVAEA
jgi:hypothetical protein